MPRGQYFIILWDLKLARTVGLDDGTDLTIALPADEQLSATAAIKGVLKDAAGEPCPFAPVYVEVFPNWWRITDADAAGLFSLESIAEGTHRLIVPRDWDSTNRYSTYRGTIVVGSADSDLKTIVLPPP